jgi:hypothetical protein
MHEATHNVGCNYIVFFHYRTKPVNRAAFQGVSLEKWVYPGFRLWGIRVQVGWNAVSVIV